MYFYPGNPSISTTFQTASKSRCSLNILNKFQSSVYVNLYAVYDAVRQCGGNGLTETKEGKLGLILLLLELLENGTLGLSVGVRETLRKTREYPLGMSIRQTNNNQVSSLEWFSSGAVCRVACVYLARGPFQLSCSMWLVDHFTQSKPPKAALARPH